MESVLVFWKIIVTVVIVLFHSETCFTVYVLTNISNLSYSFLCKLLRKTYDECNPCSYHYDAIIKMETFSEDVSHILETVGAGWIAPAHANNRGN